MRKLMLATIFLLAASTACADAMDDGRMVGHDQSAPELQGHSHADDKGDWRMFGHDLRRSFSNPGSDLTPQNVGSLKLAWSFHTEDAVTAAPAVVGGMVYVGAWDGYFYALSKQEGKLLWKFAVDCQKAVVPVPPRCLDTGETPPDRSKTDGGLITSSAAVDHNIVYFAGGRTVYALHAADGKLLWKQRGGPNNQMLLGNDRLVSRWPARGGPVVMDDLVYFAAGIWPFMGIFIHALDARTGKVVWTNDGDGSIFIKQPHNADSFAGVAPSSVPAFVLMQLVGGACGLAALLVIHPTITHDTPLLEDVT